MATGTTEFVDSTTADVFIPEIWSQGAIVTREQRLVFAKLVDRRYEKDLKYGDIINVPTIDNLAARSKAKATNAAITYEALTETNTQITVATWEYSAMAVESIVEVQANRDLFKAYAGKMGYALDLAVDDVLAGLPDDATNAVGALAVGLTYDDLLRARQYLDDANAPVDDRYIVVAPAEEANLMKLDHFINRDYSALVGGSTRDPDRGWFGTWLGMPVYKSTNVEGSNAAGHDNAMFHREAYALVIQMKPKAHHMYDIDYFVDKVAIEQLYGTQTMRNAHGVFMRGA